MLRITQAKSASAVRAYYASDLEGGDYYTREDGASSSRVLEHEPGRWGGLGAERLELSGPVDPTVFAALSENRLPVGSGRLTPRSKANRRPGYDINFHAPKSLSLLHRLGGDDRIAGAFRAAVEHTMTVLEREASTRIRGKGRDEDRVTGNLIWASFVHELSRPVEGVPDPHLHAHCFTFNATWDEGEGRWKALQLGGVKAEASFFEAVFHADLAARVRALGYDIERSGRFWEIAGVPRELVKAFSRRTAQVEEVAKRKGVTAPKEKAELGARTRSKKSASRSPSEIEADWRARLQGFELPSIPLKARERAPGHVAAIDRNTGAADDAVKRALDSLLERAAVVPERRVVGEALRFGLGEVDLGAATLATQRAPALRAVFDGSRVLTTKAVMDEESWLLAFARGGRGREKPLVPGWSVPEALGLSKQQAKVAAAVLASKDRVTLVRGGAGTGKTTALKAVYDALTGAGAKVAVLAPSASASRGTLRAEGFTAADTVSQFLASERLQDSARGGVILVDEAGLLGSRSMHKLFRSAEELKARVILAGDRRQHGPVERGDVLRMLEDRAGLDLVELTAIRRQTGTYREAVQAISEGRHGEGLDRLRRMEAVHEVPDRQARLQAAADSYIEAVSRGLQTLVIAPTHTEGSAVTEAVRERLKEMSTVGQGRTVSALRSRMLTEAERAFAGSYGVGDVVQFNRAAPSFRAGDRATVTKVDSDDAKVWVATVSGKLRPLPLAHGGRFEVYEPVPLEVAPGDLVRVTRNGTTKDGGSKLHNGTVHRVRGVGRDGAITLADGRVLGEDFAHLSHGYVVTSPAAQGRSVDKVILVQSAESRGAASPEQFYVSVSRGRREVTIFTDDIAALRGAVCHARPRLNAHDIVPGFMPRTLTRSPERARQVHHERDR